MLRVENLTVASGPTPLSFAVSAGQCVGLLGSSQPHISQLMRAAAGLTRPAGGTVQIDGIDTTHDADTARRRVAIAWPQTVASSLRLQEYLQTVAHARRATGTITRSSVTAAIDRLGLDGTRVLSTPAARSEAALAAALLPAVGLIVLDDPFREINAETRARAIEWIRALAAEAVAVLIGGVEERDLRAVSHFVIPIERPR